MFYHEGITPRSHGLGTPQHGLSWSRKRKHLPICSLFLPLALVTRVQIQGLKVHRMKCRKAPSLSPPVALEQRQGPFFIKGKKMIPQSRAPAARHPRALPTPSSDYLVFSSFTRITLQKPRSIMLLWKRDSCQRGARTACPWGALANWQRKAHALSSVVFA